MSEELRYPLGTNLMRPCARCAKVREKLQELNDLLRGFVLEGRLYEAADAAGRGKPEVLVYGPYQLICGDCQGTGLEPTKRGRRLLAFVRQFIDGVSSPDLHISPKEIESEEEIPF